MIKISSRYEVERLIKLNEFIHHGTPLFKYHMEHIQLVSQYSLILNERLGANIDPSKLIYIALAHDLFKERSLNNKKRFIEWSDPKGGYPEVLELPQNLNWYIRSNLNTLERYDLSDYFNTDIQQHPLAAGLFLAKQLKIEDPDILYPIFFHSCPIMPVYNDLSEEVRIMVDIVMLADKLSSNWLKINYREMPVRCDLDLIVFGENGKEFNYTMGLYVARLISQGRVTRKWAVEATDHYHKRLMDMNPLIPKRFSFKKLGGVKKWQKRNSQLLRMP